MKHASMLAAYMTLASWGFVNTQQATAATFSYTGNKLIPDGGGGVPGVTKLSWILSGDVPANGTCNNEQVTAISDGANTLAGLLAAGWVYAPNGNGAQVCAEKRTGKLTYLISVDLAQYENGVIVSTILWQSVKPVLGKGGYADYASYSFLNGNPESSYAGRPGKLTVNQ